MNKKEQLDIKLIKNNKENPRHIKKEQLEKLSKSIKEFPDMLETRPIIIDENMIVLGGNMRLQACKNAGLKKVWVEHVKWTEDQKRQFIIKDNASFGEWDIDILTSFYDETELEDWGLEFGFDDTPTNDEESNNNTEDEEEFQEGNDDNIKGEGKDNIEGNEIDIQVGDLFLLGKNELKVNDKKDILVIQEIINTYNTYHNGKKEIKCENRDISINLLIK